MFNFFKKKPEKDNTTPNLGALDKFKAAVSKTQDALVSGIMSLVNSAGNTTDEFLLEDIEALLIKADVGVLLAEEITSEIKSKKLKPSEIKGFLREKFTEILELGGDNKLKFDKDKLNIYFVTGVNGAGKTTFIGKLSARMKLSGNKVLLAAGDTFRAAAEEQLEIWSKRAQVDIVREDKIDPAAVVYKAIEKAKNEQYNVLIIDTAGRLQNKFNLIEELKKIKSVIDKKAPDANFESLLVLDANLGQNGLVQAKVFKEAVELNGIVLTKLDGSSKGGVIFSIAKEYLLPVKLIGIGEKIEDIKDFDRNEFISAIFD